jgi:hypothetical protein
MINRPMTSLLSSAVPMAQEQFGYTPTQMMAGSAVPSVQQMAGYTRQPPMVNVPDFQINVPELDSLLATAPQQKTSMLSGLLSGPGSSARYGALAKALTQNSATPMSLGQRLTGGLLAGSDAAKAQEEAAFKRGLLEKEMALETEKVRLKGLEVTGNKAGDIFDVIDANTGDIVGQVVSGTEEYLAQISNPDTLLSKTGTTQPKSKDNALFEVYGLNPETGLFDTIVGTMERGDVSPYLNNPEYAVAPAGKGIGAGILVKGMSPDIDLNKDSRLNSDGTVTVLLGSKTAQELNLKEGELTLSQDEFRIRREKADREKQQFEIDQQNEQILKERQKDKAYSQLGSTVRLIDTIENQIESSKNDFIGLFGAGASIADFPLVGASSSQGVLKNQVDQLLAQLSIDTIQQMKSQSATGATGFGALNKEELKIIQDFRGRLARETSPEEFKRVLNELKIFFNASYYGVKNERGIIEPYSPSKHDKYIYKNDPTYTINTPAQQRLSGQKIRRYINGQFVDVEQ